MREHLYRGKDKETGKWVFGSLLIREEESPIPETTETYKQYFIVIGALENYEHGVIPETVGEFTGLLDRNGVKIFEVDICQFNYAGMNHIGNISYADGEWKIDCPQSVGYEPFNRYFSLVSELEVIGNIHDNPRLRK
jgi:uncharacterized phage protein (TIGR01671 family)